LAAFAMAPSARALLLIMLLYGFVMSVPDSLLMLHMNKNLHMYDCLNVLFLLFLYYSFYLFIFIYLFIYYLFYLYLFIIYLFIYFFDDFSSF
jgi:hypothetical protein